MFIVKPCICSWLISHFAFSNASSLDSAMIRRSSSFVASESSFFVGQTFWSSLSFFVGMLTFGYLTPNEPELIDNFGCNRWF
ncbi:unnamed protein product [Rhizophagus irregularis]|nr:unnamed protein product [Rhizophagus irregularis]